MQLWEESLKIGVIVPLFKKGDRDNPGNYRGVCLLPMARRILSRVLAERLRIWVEELILLDDEQAGFRKNRSTADACQIMLRLHKDTLDLRRRMEAAGIEVNEDMMHAARLLDLKKAYPRVNRHKDSEKVWTGRDLFKSTPGPS